MCFTFYFIKFNGPEIQTLLKSLGLHVLSLCIFIVAIIRFLYIGLTLEVHNDPKVGYYIFDVIPATCMTTGQMARHNTDKASLILYIKGHPEKRFLIWLM